MVLVEALVCILNDEGVHHGYRRGCAETVAFATCTFGDCTAWGTQSTRLHRGAQGWASSNRLSAAWAVAFLGASWRGRTIKLVLPHGALTAVWASIHVVRSLLTLDEAHRGEVEDDHVVELLGQLKNAAKDVHLVSICNCRMTTSAEGT